MCKKLFYLCFVFVLSLACTSYADVIVIGDFEDGSMDGWSSPGTATIGTVGATTGSACVDVTGGGYWALSWEGPYLLDLTTATTLEMDVTMRVSDFVDGSWTNPGEKIAINSDLGWREFTPTERINRDTGEPYGGTDWGTWSGDQNLTIVYDISGADWTGILSSSFIGVSIALNDPSGTGIFHIDNIRIDGATIVPFPEPVTTVPFSLQAVSDNTIDNGPRWGQDGGNPTGTGLEARDVADRRHVFLISYDISSLKGRGPVSNVSLSNFSHNLNDEVNVYGIIEDLDLLDVESLTWNTAPGVKNDPAPELNSSVVTALDMNELTDVLLTFSGPGEQGLRFSTDTSDALADFINSDTDGIITLLFAPAAEGNQLIVRSRENSSGGTFLEGDVAPIANIIWVSDNKGYGTEPNLAADHGFVDLLRANGYLVDYKNEFEYIDGTQYWRTLDDDKVAELEAADLVIMSRNGDSGSYSTAADNEPNKWNAVTTPIISLSAYMARSNKWGWLDGTSTFRAKEAMMQVIDPTHPVFAGVTIDPNGLVEATSDQYYMDWVTGVIDAGNGIILATRPEDGLLSIVTWEAGQKYFDGSLYTAGGPRMLFIAGTGSGNNAPEYSPDGAYNLTADGETMFLNAVAYMLAPEPEGPSTEGLLAYYALEGDVLDSSGNGFNGTIVGDPIYVDGAIGMAMDFNGDDYIDCGNDENFSVTEYLTVALWVNIRTIPTAWTGAITKGNTAWRISNNNLSTGMHFGFENGSRGWQAANSTTQLNIGEWYHVCGVYDINVGAKIYINGLEDGSNPDTAGITQNTSIVAIGTNSDSTYPEQAWDGLLDEVMIYNRALSVDEVAALAGM